MASIRQSPGLRAYWRNNLSQNPVSVHAGRFLLYELAKNIQHSQGFKFKIRFFVRRHLLWQYTEERRMILNFVRGMWPGNANRFLTASNKSPALLSTGSRYLVSPVQGFSQAHRMDDTLRLGFTQNLLEWNKPYGTLKCDILFQFNLIYTYGTGEQLHDGRLQREVYTVLSKYFPVFQRPGEQHLI